MLISSKKTEILVSRIEKSKDIFCSGLYLSARWFVLSQAVSDGIHLIVLPDSESAEYCAVDLYGLIQGDRIFYLPESGKGIERTNHRSSLSVQRTTAIEKILGYTDGLLCIVSYPEALNEKLPDESIIRNSIVRKKKGDEISHSTLMEKLFEKGFEKVDFVALPGQYAVRGSIIDIFSFSDNYPYRLSFFGNEIEYIRKFNPDTQLSVETVNEIEIISDVISSDAGSLSSLFSILPSETTVWFDSSDKYSDEDFYREACRFRDVYLDVPLSKRGVDTVQFSISPQPVFNKNFELLSADISSRIEGGYNVFIYGEKESQLDRIASILSQNNGRIPKFIKGVNIHNGFVDSENKVCCYSDHEIFDRFHRVTMRRTVEKTEQLTLNDLNSFNIGDYVVHIDHGVGIFGGLVRMHDDHDRVHEVIKITYKDNDVVFVSVNSLNRISRFKSRDGEPPKINKLGSRTWSLLKSGAKSKVKDIAKDLIQLYAKRKASDGFAFSPDSYLQQELESSFMYEDTPDQEAATAAVKKDMEESCPMDRLICGDVGFGKTEVAIRAAFKAVCDSKQVAVLVPTTILALQHFNTFSSRLGNFPCNVEYVSRLRTSKEINDIKSRLRKGAIDILIGTHKILGEGFEFKDLGLLIIDEEQKFGVSAKERLRTLSAGVDTLTLTATPIPRTLQFSLLGARDLSIINTAPPNRIPVQTELMLFNEKEIRGILNYELNRGGQIFFLHNKVEELPSIHEILHRLVPDMKICMAHGRMEARELENRMLSFIRGDYDLLLCTTIIENGLDIPNANTIIVNQAQNIGLSDLHQLRGRVGRSNRRAFCYLIVPPMTTLTDDARRRLKAIEECSDLGSGFNIAMQDLDIRGAGNLLGAQQSGFISDMGYETYQKILSEAMSELGMETGIEINDGNIYYCDDCTIETDQRALIPDEFIDVTAEKIRIYKQLDSMSNDKEINIFANQLSDRFGRLPEETLNLIYVVKLRNLGQKLGFDKIIVKNGMFIAFFTANPLYFKSDVFQNLLSKVSGYTEGKYNIKQTETRLKIVSRGINGLGEAYDHLKRLQ